MVKLLFLCLVFFRLFVFKVIQISYFTICILISFAFSLFKEDKKEFEIPTISDSYVAFISDFYIENNSIFYTFWNENGLQTKKLAIKVSSFRRKNISIENNTIYVGKEKIILPKSNKKKAMIINKNTLVFFI